MSAKKESNKKAIPSTVITLTMLEEDGDQRSGTLLIQRGDLAHIRQFSCTNLDEIAVVLKEAVVALSAVEADPPVIPHMESKPEAGKRDSTATPTAPADEEPTIDVPTKTGSVAVKISHLKIVAGESDAAAYRQAALAAGRLIDGKLWDGQTPICFDDVAGVQRKLQHLTDKDLSLFALGDFVQAGSASDQPQAESDPVTIAVQDGASSEQTSSVESPLSANGSQSATDQADK